MQSQHQAAISYAITEYNSMQTASAPQHLFQQRDAPITIKLVKRFDFAPDVSQWPAAACSGCDHVLPGSHFEENHTVAISLLLDCNYGICISKFLQPGILLGIFMSNDACCLVGPRPAQMEHRNTPNISRIWRRNSALRCC